MSLCAASLSCVVPLAGTWIEIIWYLSSISRYFVVPLAGTWIEISLVSVWLLLGLVVPLAGTWIEIYHRLLKFLQDESFPSRERGLK